MSTPVHYIYRINLGFVPLVEQKILRTFQGHISNFSRTSFSAKKSLESMSFLALPHQEEFYPEGLSVFTPFPLLFPLNYKVSIEISRTFQRRLHFQGLSMPRIFISNLKTFKRIFNVRANPANHSTFVVLLSFRVGDTHLWHFIALFNKFLQH